MFVAADGSRSRRDYVTSQSGISRVQICPLIRLSASASASASAVSDSRNIVPLLYRPSELLNIDV
jgi:hypothetical protein